MPCFLFNRPNQDASFQYAVGIVLKHEGGLSKDKNDPGGTTNWGISQRFLNDNHIVVKAEDMTRKQAISLYRLYWWNKYPFDEIKDLYVCTKVFDAAVNMGPEQSFKILQRSINMIPPNNITVDGQLGKKTISACNQCNSYSLMNAIRENMKNYYLELVKEKPKLSEFLVGWLSRAAW
jgi:lysozyme family protein